MIDAHDAKAREIVEAFDPDNKLDEIWTIVEERLAAALRDCERQTLERAAKVAREKYWMDMFCEDPKRWDDTACIETAIRALGTNDTTG